MREVNVNVYTGWLTNEVSVKEFNSGSTLYSGCLTVKRSYKKDGEWVNSPPVFVHFKHWPNKMFDMSTRLLTARKGDRVLLSGSRQAEEYEGKDGSQKRFEFLQLDNFQFLESRNRQHENAEEPKENMQGVLDDDIPF